MIQSLVFGFNIYNPTNICLCIYVSPIHVRGNRGKQVIHSGQCQTTTQDMQILTDKNKTGNELNSVPS